MCQHDGDGDDEDDDGVQDTGGCYAYGGAVAGWGGRWLFGRA